MSKQHPLVRRIIIMAVVHRLRRHRARVIERQDFRSNEGGVVAIGNGQDAQRANNYRQGIHLVSLGGPMITAHHDFAKLKSSEFNLQVGLSKSKLKLELNSFDLSRVSHLESCRS